jgi:two-component system, OmpR family, response regulator RpaA
MGFVPKILIVSNLQTTSHLWALDVTQQHWDIILETHPAKATQRWAELLPDLIVCDIDPDSLSIDVITKLRDEAVLPILLLTSSRSDKFLLEAYEAGIDECILKPIHPLLFESKLTAWLRRSSTVPVDVLEALRVGDLQLIPSDRSLILDKRAPIHLTDLELRLLYYLMRRPGHTVSTEELFQRVWRHYGDGDMIRLKNLVYRLRRKMEADPAHPHYVHTVSGVGYQFLVK